MAQSQNTINEILVGTAVAAETTLDTFKATASPGELQVFAFDGTAVAEGKPFVFAQKTADSVFVSDVIYPATVKNYTVSADVAEVAQVVTVVPPATVVAGKDVTLRIHIFEHGSLSVEDTYIKFATYRTVTGDDQEDIVDGLIASLNRNFSREPNATPTSNPLFSFAKGASSQSLTVTTAPTVSGNATVVVDGTNVVVALLDTDTTSTAATKIAAAIDVLAGYTSSASGAIVTVTNDAGEVFTLSYSAGTTASAATIAIVATAAQLIITQKLQPYVRGKKFGRVNPFAVFVSFSGDEDYIQAELTTPYNPGKGTGKLVAAMEYDLRKNRGDVYGDIGWPYNFDVITRANSAAGYNMLTLVHSRGHEGFNPVHMRKQVTIAITEALSAGIDALIARVNTLTGQSVAALGEV